MTRYSPGGGAGTCPLVPGSRARPRRWAAKGATPSRRRPGKPHPRRSRDVARLARLARPSVTGLAGGEPGRGSVVSPGLVRISGRRRRGLNAPPPSPSKRMCCRGRVGWCGSSRALGLVNRFTPARDASPRQEQISAERHRAGFSMPCGAAAMRHGGLEKRGFDFGQEVYCLQPTERAACCPTCPGVTSCKRTANREIVLLRVGN